MQAWQAHANDGSSVVVGFGLAVHETLGTWAPQASPASRARVPSSAPNLAGHSGRGSTSDVEALFERDSLPHRPMTKVKILRHLGEEFTNQGSCLFHSKVLDEKVHVFRGL